MSFSGYDRITNMQFAEAPTDFSEVGTHTNSTPGASYHISTRWETADNQITQRESNTEVGTGMIAIWDHGVASGDFLRAPTNGSLMKLKFAKPPRLCTMREVNKMLAAAHGRYYPRIVAGIAAVVAGGVFPPGLINFATSPRISIPAAILAGKATDLRVSEDPDYYLTDINWLTHRFSFAGIVTSSKVSSGEIPFRSIGQFRTMKYVDNPRANDSWVICIERVDAASPFQLVPRAKHSAPLFDFFDAPLMHTIPQMLVGRVREVSTPSNDRSYHTASFVALHTPQSADEKRHPMLVTIEITAENRDHR